MWRTKTDIRIQKPRPHCHTNWIWFLWTLSLSLVFLCWLSFFFFFFRFGGRSVRVNLHPIQLKACHSCQDYKTPKRLPKFRTQKVWIYHSTFRHSFWGFLCWLSGHRQPAIMPWHSAISLQIPQPSRGQNGQTRPCYVRAWIQRLRTCEESPCTAEIPIFQQIDLARVSKTLMLGIQKNLSRKYLEKGN